MNNSATLEKTINYKNLLLKYFSKIRNEHTCENKSGCCNKEKTIFGCMNDHSKEKQFYYKSFKEKMNCLMQYKSEGDKLFKCQEYKSSKEFYKKGLLLFELVITSENEELIKIDNLKVLYHLNLSQCRIKMKEFSKAISKDLNYVLKIDKQNIKALYRKTLCLIELMNESESLALINQVKSMDGFIFEDWKVIFETFQKYFNKTLTY